MSSGVTVEKCVDAIKALADHKGSSRVALVKYFKNALHIDNPAAVAAVLKGVCVSVIGLWRAADTRRGAEGVSRGVLTQTLPDALRLPHAPRFSRLKRMAVLVSKSDHCLYDLLIRHQSGELPCAIPVIISNHADLEHVAKQFSIPFRHLPMDAALDKEAAKAAQEATLEALLAEEDVCTLLRRRLGCACCRADARAPAHRWTWS